MSKPILCVDFDGVIHSYTSGWKGADVVSDPPVPGALQWLERATETFDVQVYSSRSSQPGGIEAMVTWMLYWSGVISWAKQRDFVPDISFPTQKPAAFLTIDDRAICFDGNWDALDPVELARFKPWNKREAQSLK